MVVHHVVTYDTALSKGSCYIEGGGYHSPSFPVSPSFCSHCLPEPPSLLSSLPSSLPTFLPSSEAEESTSKTMCVWFPIPVPVASKYTYRVHTSGLPGRAWLHTSQEQPAPGVSVTSVAASAPTIHVLPETSTFGNRESVLLD